MTLRNLTPLVAFCVLLAGCATKLAPGGAYNNDVALYQADLIITTSYDVLHKFVQWEFNNRPALSNMPEIKQAADRVRLQAPGLVNSAIALREVYASTGSPESRDGLQTTIAMLRQLMVEATKHMATLGGHAE